MIKVRPGIVLIHVCDQSLLVSAYEARQHCPYVTILNETGEVIWNCLNEGKSVSDIVQKVTDMFDIPSDIKVEQMIIGFIEQLYKNGYVLFEEEREYEL